MGESAHPRIIRILLGTFLLVLAGLTAHQPALAVQRALLIANENYSGSPPPLPGVIAEANKFSQTLAKLGYSIENNGPYVNQDQHNMQTHIDHFISQVSDGDTVVIYFSGHGYFSGGENELLPIGASTNFPSISLETNILDKLRQKNLFALIVFIDACRSPTNMRPLAQPTKSLPSNSFIFFATGSTRDTLPSSPFTKALVERLSTDQLAVPGEDIKTIKDKVTRDVQERAHLTPEVYESLTKPFFFVPPAWEVLRVQWAAKAKAAADWRDVSWLKESNDDWLPQEGWLAGVLQWGGGPGNPIGQGVLLRTIDRGRTWTDVTNSVQSGSGRVGSVTWDNVGPIYELAFTDLPLPVARRNREGTMASATGIYRALYIPGAEKQDIAWERLTRPPSQNPMLEQFTGLAFSENDVYALGWSGIAYAPDRGRGPWSFQKQTFSYYINRARALGDPAHRRLWAVGQDARGERGAVYRLSYSPIEEKNVWEEESLAGVTFTGKQNGFLDIELVTDEIAVAVGKGGLLVRCSNLDQPGRRWEALGWWEARDIQDAIKNDPKNLRDLPTANLNSIAKDSRGVLWAVGDNGLMLRSDDLGASWKLVPRKIDGRDVSENLNRIRFFGEEGSIVGERGMVLITPKHTVTAGNLQ